MTPLSFVVYTKSIFPLTVSPRDDMSSFTAASIWFEIWGSWIRVNKISIFQAGSKKISVFAGKFSKNFDFFRQIFEKFRFCQEIKKKFDFPGKNCSFTATSGQIILFLF